MKLGEVLTGPETWCQHSYRQWDGPTVATRNYRRCLLGGLQAVHGVATSHQLPEAAWVRLSQAIFEVGESCDIIGWNDAPGRTWEEVAQVVARYDELTRIAEMGAGMEDEASQKVWTCPECKILGFTTPFTGEVCWRCGYQLIDMLGVAITRADSDRISRDGP